LKGEGCQLNGYWRRRTQKGKVEIIKGKENWKKRLLHKASGRKRLSPRKGEKKKEKKQSKNKSRNDISGVNKKGKSLHLPGGKSSLLENSLKKRYLGGNLK